MRSPQRDEGSDPMATGTRSSLSLAEAIRKTLSTARGIAHAYPIALSAVLAATGMSFAPNAEAGNTIFVTTNGDPGPLDTLSLRQAVAAANSGDTIEFAPALIGSTITLASGQIAIHKAMTIAGPGADLLMISGNNASRIFYVNPVPDDANPDHTPVTISSLTLTQGKASSASGGAIHAFHTRLLLQYSTISASKASLGGGVYSLFGKIQLEHSRLTGNQAALRGGALYSISDDSVNVYSDTLSGNYAGEVGGGACIGDAIDVRIKDSTISGNVVPQPSNPYSGPQGGGGIALHFIGAGQIYNSTIAQNYAPTGGAGVALLDSFTGNATTFSSSTIAGNIASVDETGIGITSAGGTVALTESIVSNNISQGSADDLAGSFKSYRSLIKNPGGATITGSFSVIGLDPQLGPLADNGGATLTMLPATTSPVIDKVPCLCSLNQLVDQRGFQRHDSNTDIGAVERQYPEPLIFRNGFGSPLN
jgi:hypothetical protein